MTADNEATSSIRYSPPAVMTLEEVAVYLGFAEATIRRMLRDREIPAAKVAGQWRFLKAEVDRWLEGLSAKTLSSPALPGFDRATCLNLSKRILESFPGDPTAEAIAKIVLLSAELASQEDEEGQPQPEYSRGREGILRLTQEFKTGAVSVDVYLTALKDIPDREDIVTTEEVDSLLTSLHGDPPAVFAAKMGRVLSDFFTDSDEG